MSLHALLAARAHAEGRGQRSASLRHRRLLDRPFGLVFWQLGAEPFSAAAVGWGRDPDDLTFDVAGDPRNRDLAFRALLGFADPFLDYFEAPSAHRESDDRGRFEQTISIPQLIVPNAETVEMIGRLGRRLAYLPTDGQYAADPKLVRLGQHFLFIGRHAKVPGQQLIVPIADLMRTHWVCALSDYESASLAALDAYVEPPAGMHGFRAAVAAEVNPVGPRPEGELDVDLEPLVDAFNEARRRRTDAKTIGPLLLPIRAHYEPLVMHSYELMWRGYERERDLAEAPSCERRFRMDCDAYTRHMDWTLTVGRRRTRQTARQAAMTVRALEDAQSVMLAEEATDDPLRMVPYLLDGKALEGEVVRVDDTNMELVTTRRARRPLVTLTCDEPCRIPRGRTLWWSQHPRGPGWALEQIAVSGSGATVTLKLMTSAYERLPVVGERACFSALHTDTHYRQRLPYEAPWTHTPAVTPPPAGDIEESEAA